MHRASALNAAPTAPHRDQRFANFVFNPFLLRFPARRVEANTRRSAGSSALNRRLLASLVPAVALVVGVATQGPSFASAHSRTANAAPPVPAPASSPASLGTIRTIAYQPVGARGGSVGLSYDLWATYNPTQVQSDLALIKGTGANAVRVFISTGDTGSSYPQVSATFSRNLSNFVRLAHNAGLKAVLSIFNQFPYIPTDLAGWSDITPASAWMAAVVNPYRSDSDIAYIEMRNEVPAPGYESPDPVGSGLLAATWLNTMMPRLRTDAGTDPIVLSNNHGVAGYESLDAALSSAAKPDAFAYHFYDWPGFLYGQLTALQHELSRPVFVGETGMSTATSYAQGGAAGLTADTVVRDSYQGWYLQAVASVTSALGLGVPGVWQLWDTPNAKSTVEATYGLFDDTTGSPVPKPAVATLSKVYAAAAAGLPISPPSINGTFNDPGTAVGTEIPSPWNAYYIAGQTSPSAAQGGQSLCITYAGTDSYFYQALPLAGVSGAHILSVWSKDGNGYTSVALRWLDMSGNPIGPDVRTWQPGSQSNWYQLVVNGIAPPGASTVEVILQGDTSGCFSNVTFS